MSEEITREQACDTLRNAAWLGTNEDRERIERAVELLCGELCEDAISRQTAIDAFSMFAEYESNRTNAEWVDRIRVVLSSLPPVQPIRPRGHWIGIDDEPSTVFECDICGTTYDTVDNMWDVPDFCPNCGADMRESED